MKKLITVLLTAMWLIASSAYADTFDDAIKAIEARNYTQAFKLFKQLALKGDATAQYNLGVAYSNGEGVAQDYVEAVRWYKLAAAQGNVSAQAQLGDAYYLGQGVTQDYAEAAKWFKLVAAQGRTQAQLNLVSMYSEGQGVTQDYVIAHMWCNIAAAQGDKKAVEFRGLLEKRMTPQQLAEAQKLARECVARNYKGC